MSDDEFPMTNLEQMLNYHFTMFKKENGKNKIQISGKVLAWGSTPLISNTPIFFTGSILPKMSFWSLVPTRFLLNDRMETRVNR